MLKQGVKKELARIVGPDNAAFEREDLIVYSYDATGMRYLPEAVVFPRSAEEVSLILKLAGAEGFPVTPRGAGSGFTGGALAAEGGVVLSIERMNRVLEVDPDNMYAVVEPGVVNYDLRQEVEPKGLFYPPDPTSLKFSTIGGNIAECAGGPNSVKYGVTRDYVMALEVVLPTGEVIRTGTRTKKGVVGFDLTGLMVGSEGTLGVVTEATLRLVPKPEAVRTMLAVFPDMRAAAGAVPEIIRSRIVPSTLEFIDGVSIRCVTEHTEVELPEAEALLLIEVDGDPGEVERQARGVEEIVKRAGASEVRTATEKREVKDLWKARRSLSQSMFKVKPNKINEDVVVPRTKIPELVEGVRSIADEKGLTVPCFGHAGDGNIHVNVMYDAGDPEETSRAGSAVEEVFELVLGLGGTISGEHGVGLTKAPYLPMEMDENAVALMERVKKAFDPKGILNPGKIFKASKDRGAA